MAEGILFNIVEDILKNLGSRALNEIASAWGFKAQLEKLRNTVNTIKDVLQDAEERQLQSRAIRGWLERLKAAVYDADDLFDELATMAWREEVMGRRKLSKEVKTFFSRSNHIAVGFSISNKIKHIRKKLDEIVKDGSEFAFVLRPYEEQRVVYRQERETHSFVDAQEVIGRDDDKKAILNILHQNQDQRVCVVPIVGIGGMGKTTLAQVVYNEVEKHFDLSLWVCVSDNFDIKEIIIKILKSATNTEPQNLELDQLQKQLRSQLIEKKYLLVLDDVWNDDADKWRELSVLLKVCKEGSKILVTTRSMEVGKIMGTIPDPYHLEGLSEDKSLTLFTKIAFAPGQEDKDPELLSIGERIVKKCANVPLAIRTLASLLRGREKRVWLNMKDRSLAQIPENENRIMGILKVSYHHLKSPLKNCFAYCALFPKDYSFKKKTLISLWMAQGFIIPAHESQSLEDAGEEYFLTLMERCFFQDITRDKWGNINSCKMHDLMHDLAQEVAGHECRMAKLGEMDLDNRIHHLSFGYGLTSWQKIPSTMLNLKRLRTFLLPTQIHDGSAFSEPICHQLLSSYRSLRMLDLHDLGVASLPSSISNLVQLRYINLSRTPIEELPNSITELQNLQTLELHACRKLGRLPTDIKKLANLRILDVSDCWSLTHMPSGLGVLTSLHSLPFFMVNFQNSRAVKGKTSTAQLCDLKNLNNLKGSLKIKINGELRDPAYEAKEANLSSKHALMKLHIDLDLDGLLTSIQHDEAILEGLKPHRNLKKLRMYQYSGEKLPSWAVNDNLCTTLPNLVEVELWKFERCQQVPSFSQLPSLKRLHLLQLESVEYIESSMPVFPSSAEEVLFFPSLQELWLVEMQKLKGWWREVEEVVDDDQTALPFGKAKLRHQLGESFPNLLELAISLCPNLKSIPRCPEVGNLSLVDVNENLSVLKMAAGSEMSVASSSTSSGSSSKLKTLTISNVEALISLPQESLSQLTTLYILDDRELLNVSRLEDLFKNLNSLSSLEFLRCDNLRSINGGLEHLTALEKLVLWSCPELDLSPSQDVEDSMPWRALNNLQCLNFDRLPKLAALPKGLQHLTNLRTLRIDNFDNLEALPEWISCFSSLVDMKVYNCGKLTSLPEGFRELTKLNRLRIAYCRGLTKRCRGPTGEDWPKIQHIPLVIVEE